MNYALKESAAQLRVMHYELCIKKKAQPNYALCIMNCALKEGAAQLCIVHYELCIN